MAAFATTAELEAYLQRSFNEAEQGAAELALRFASAAIRAFTRQTISLVTDDEVVLAGTYGRKLVLPERPVVDVTSVGINGVPIAAIAYQVTRDTLWWGAGPLNIANQAEALGGGWGTPATPLEVTYSHGYAVIPDDVKAVCLALAARRVDQPAAVASETVGGYSVTYGSTSGLNDDEKILLRRYRKAWQ